MSLNRRDFLKTSALGSSLIFLPKINNFHSEDIGDTVSYKGFSLIWKGFYGSYDSERIICSWISLLHTQDKEFIIYSLNTGLEGIVRKGQVYDLTINTGFLGEENRYYPVFLEDYINNPNLAQEIKLDTLNRIKKVVDNLEEYRKRDLSI